MKSVAIVLPTRNRCAMLRRTLASLQAQTFREFHVYVSDDSSTDETASLNASSFPGLKITWTRRTQPFADIPAHFSALFAEAQEEWIALVHDDEVYAPEWLETLTGLMERTHPSGLPVVMAQTHETVVDLRHGAARYYSRRNSVPEGLYAGVELKREMVFNDRHLNGNGFMVSREAAGKTGPMNGAYEQFDFEWLVRVAEQGITAISGQLLHTYTMHPQNTVGSPGYLRRYFGQKNPWKMKEEWLLSLDGTPSKETLKCVETFRQEGSRARFRSFLKLVASGSRALCNDALPQIETDRNLPEKYKIVARLACLPLVFGVAHISMKILLAKLSRRQHPDLEQLDSQDAARDFKWR